MKIQKKFIPIFESIDLTTRRIPMLIADSGKPGPVIGLGAAIHGDEVTGTAVISSIFQKMEKLPLLKGKIFAFPILNPSGFEVISRQEVYAGEDLNRSFDSKDKGSTAEILASAIMKTIVSHNPDLFIDLHTDSKNSIAYILVDEPTENIDSQAVNKSISLAGELGFPWGLDTEEASGYRPEQCLSGQLVKRNIPAVTIELGGPLVVAEKFRRLGLVAVWNLLYKKGLVFEPIDGQERYEQKNKRIIYGPIRVKSTGIIDYRVKPGDWVKKKDLLAKVRNVFGEIIEEVYAPTTGMIFSHEDKSVVFPGQSVFTLAVDRH